MYQLWQHIKPFFKPFFATEEQFSLAKEKTLLFWGWLSGRPIAYRHQLPILLEYLRLRGQGVEVGVRDGAYSETILRYSRLSKLYSVDSWQEYRRKDYNDASNVSQDRQAQLFTFTRGRLAPFSSRNEILRLTSKEAAALFTDGSLDFVYIDANHSYEAVTEDIKLWWPKVKSGGVFAGHDYVNGDIKPQGVFGVKSAVDEFVQTYAQKVYLTPEKWPTWYVIKNNELRTRFSLYNYLRQEIDEQYKNSSLWRQIRGIRSQINENK